MKSMTVCPGLPVVSSALCLLCPQDSLLCPFHFLKGPGLDETHGRPMITGSQSSRRKPGGANIVTDVGFHDKEVPGDFSSRCLSCEHATRVSEGEVSEKQSKLF